jgi:hypothetical protein
MLFLGQELPRFISKENTSCCESVTKIPMRTHTDLKHLQGRPVNIYGNVALSITPFLD